jgi:hypothetical protein
MIYAQILQLVLLQGVVYAIGGCKLLGSHIPGVVG